MANDRIAIHNHLQQFRRPGGGPDFEALIRMPAENRISVMAAENQVQVAAAISAITSSALANVNHRINEDGILDFALDAISTSGEDGITLEDVALFFRQLLTGAYGQVYGQLDQITLADRWEQYRQERWDASRRMREELDAQFKALGNPDRTSQELAERDAQAAREEAAVKLDQMLKKLAPDSSEGARREEKP